MGFGCQNTVFLKIWNKKSAFKSEADTSKTPKGFDHFRSKLVVFCIYFWMQSSIYDPKLLSNAHTILVEFPISNSQFPNKFKCQNSKIWQKNIKEISWFQKGLYYGNLQNDDRKIVEKPKIPAIYRSGSMFLFFRFTNSFVSSLTKDAAPTPTEIGISVGVFNFFY